MNEVEVGSGLGFGGGRQSCRCNLHNHLRCEHALADTPHTAPTSYHSDKRNPFLPYTNSSADTSRSSCSALQLTTPDGLAVVPHLRCFVVEQLHTNSSLLGRRHRRLPSILHPQGKWCIPICWTSAQGMGRIDSLQVRVRVKVRVRVRDRVRIREGQPSCVTPPTRSC